MTDEERSAMTVSAAVCSTRSIRFRVYGAPIRSQSLYPAEPGAHPWNSLRMSKEAGNAKAAGLALAYKKMTRKGYMLSVMRSDMTVHNEQTGTLHPSSGFVHGIRARAG